MSSTSRLRGPKSCPAISSAEKLTPRKSVVLSLPELPPIDEPGGETAQIRVRQRTLLPVIGEHGVDARAPGEAMRKQGRPAAIGPLAREHVTRTDRYPRVPPARHSRCCSASKLSSAKNLATSGTGAGAKAVEVTNDRDGSSNHTTASPPWPARPMALRGFSDSDTTRAPGFCARSSSARVVTSMRRALAFDAAGR